MGLGQKIQKIFSRRIAEQTYSDNYPVFQELTENKRGYTIYFPSQLIRDYARDDQGRMQSVSTDQPYFTLTPDQRIRISQACSPVLGIVSSRMNRVAGRKLVVVSDKEQEDLIVDRMRDIKNMINEFSKSTSAPHIIASMKLRNFLTKKLYDLLPDLSNFDASLLRWSKYNKSQTKQQADSIKSWLENPNQTDSWKDFAKQWVFDLLVHGTDAILKDSLNGKIENLYHIAGGTVFPAQGKYVTSSTGYIQIISMEEPQLFYKNELVYTRYLPISSRKYGLVPLEALVNKVTESLLFDRLMAEQADGTKLPNKMVLITDNMPFGKMDDTLKLPINKNEHKRLDKKMNTPVKGGIMSFSGNNATVVDLTRENTMSAQMQRQKDIREEVALVFNMSNMEVNLTGSGDTSGRSTSESQAEIEQGKGTLPIMALIEDRINHDVLPFRYGTGYSMQFHTEQNEREELEKLHLKMATGLYSVNEVRTKDLNEDPFEGEEYNIPPGTGQQSPDGSMVNPFNMRGV